MFDALLNNPAIIQAAVKAAGIQAARLDVDKDTGELWASLKIRGQIRQHAIPTGRIFTVEEILATLFADPATPGQTKPGKLSGPTIAKSPP